jgi:hypothetical protein
MLIAKHQSQAVQTRHAAAHRRLRSAPLGFRCVKIGPSWQCVVVAPNMARWRSADELCERYLVGEQRLLAFSRRGNLPMLQESGQIALFDEDIVARLFRRRDEEPASSEGGWGSLGSARLGFKDASPVPSARLTRTRALRRGEQTETESLELGPLKQFAS